MPPKRKHSILGKDETSPVRKRTRRSKSPQSAKKTKKAATTRKSKSAVASAKRSAAAAPAPSIIYHDNNINRSIVVLPLPLYTKYPEKKTAFYKSSGTSNDKFRGLYSNTWFPIGGLIEEDYDYKDEKLVRGFIIKMDTITNKTEKKMYKWAHKLCIDYFSQKLTTLCGDDTARCNSYTELLRILFPEQLLDIAQSNTYYRALKPYLLDISNELFELVKQLHQEYVDITSLLLHYFCNIEQLAVSAHIGGGYWEKNTEFRHYIKDTNALPFQSNTIEQLSAAAAAAEGTRPDNMSEVIEFLKRNGAQYTPEEIIENFTSDAELDSTVYYISNISNIIAQQERTRAFFARTAARK